MSIPSLRDRVLQIIVYMSLLPISEWQGDSHSFGFRPKRSAVQPVAMLANQLETVGNMKSYRGLPKKVAHNRYLTHVGLSHRSRSSLQNRDVAKRRLRYSYAYWIFTNESKKQKSHDTFYAYPRYINVDVEKYSDWISHAVILKYTPICEKYCFFIKAWLYAPIYGPKIAGSRNFVDIIPKRGVPQGAIIGPLICNIVLDGLENYVLNPLSYQYFLNSEEIKRIRKKFGNAKIQQYS